MGFNKGEWSELYGFLYLLEHPNLVIVDDQLNVLESDLFQIVEMFINDNSYQIESEKIIKLSKDGLEKKVYDRHYISKHTQVLLQKILSHKKAKGSFEIPEILPLLQELLDGKKPKGSSLQKGDLVANVRDNKFTKTVTLNYNIKSALGRPATLLNASSHTNFIYELSNINDNVMSQCNAISGRRKLLDKCHFLMRNNAHIQFVKVESETFDYNLKMIDSNLDHILAKILYLSYQNNEKEILSLLEFISENNDAYTFYKKKIADFTNAVTFGMRAGTKWDGTNEVNGGIILITKMGEVYLLDLIYFKHLVNQYLIENIKLESPSSTRYKMFEIYKERGKYYFKLNLQIRFK